jgi:hypothetical protein
LLTKAEHLEKAKHNEAFISSLDITSATGAEWAVTAAFYAALHYVQAYFVSVGCGYITHSNRSSALSRDPRLNGVYDEYRELENASRDARYDYMQFNATHVAEALESLRVVKKAVLALI